MEHGKRESERRNRTERTRGEHSTRQSTRKKRGGHKVRKVIGTLCLVGLLTGVFFTGIFLTYVNTTLVRQAEVDPEKLSQESSSILYYQDNDTGEWEELQMLKSSKKRIEIPLSEMPQYLQDAAIAIEDERFESHHGVDWLRTGKAVLNRLTGGSVIGGSTITQQLIKNLTGDNENTIKRKILEIVRALEFEKEYSKDEIMEMYLNNIALGRGCVGVQTASQRYFGKDTKDLTLAECASLIGITNNPWKYDPLRNEESLKNNQDRKELVLGKMLELEKITQEEYDQAMAEQVQFVEDATDDTNDTSTADEYNSFFVDQVIRDVSEDLAEELGISEKSALNSLYYGGYRIYTTIDPEIQEIAETVYEDASNAKTSARGQKLHSAITIVEPSTGDVVAMVGDLGEKEGDLVLNWATTVRQCGSSIKPIATYAPALDAGIITPASAIDNAPVRVLNGRPWPRNDNGVYSGLMTLSAAVSGSVNAVAVRVNEMLGVQKSFDFLTENLGITTLVSSEDDSSRNDMNSASLGLGGLTNGVTTEEMAAAFATFANNGVYNEPRLYTKVTQVDSNGTETVIIENESESHAAMKETTAYMVTKLLQTAVSSGTGRGAQFSGMSIAGKTGTTSENYDRYFAGYTPYYAAAVWCGYANNERIVSSVNPSAALWRQVMSKIHANLEDIGFSRPDGMVQVTVCKDSGLLPSDACSHDVRGESRLQTVWVAKGTEPTETCNVHVDVQYCTEGQCLAGEFCPEESVKTVSVLNYTRDSFGAAVSDTPYLLGTLEAASKEPDENGVVGCPIHTQAQPEDPVVVDPNDPNAGGSTQNPDEETGEETEEGSGDGGNGSGNGEDWVNDLWNGGSASANR